MWAQILAISGELHLICEALLDLWNMGQSIMSVVPQKPSDNHCEPKNDEVVDFCSGFIGGKTAGHRLLGAQLGKLQAGFLQFCA